MQAQDEAEAGPPSLELLEFLGEWETDNGIGFDPIVVLGGEVFKQLLGRDERDDQDAD